MPVWKKGRTQCVPKIGENCTQDNVFCGFPVNKCTHSSLVVEKEGKEVGAIVWNLGQWNTFSFCTFFLQYVGNPLAFVLTLCISTNYQFFREYLNFKVCESWCWYAVLTLACLQGMYPYFIVLSLGLSLKIWKRLTKSLNNEENAHKKATLH